MIKIKDKPSFTIDVYEGSVFITEIDKNFEFQIDSGDSYAEVKWLDNPEPYLGRFLTMSQEDSILKQFEKQQIGEV